MVRPYSSNSILVIVLRFTSSSGSTDAGAYGDAYDKAMKEWKKSKSCSLSEVGYHKYFAIASSSIGNETEFEVKEDATKADIKRAFAKTLKGKKMNKRILGEFIELVA